MSKKHKIPSRLSLYLSSGDPGWFFYDPPYQMYNILWRFHKNDVDDIISIPHGDSIDAKRKYQLNPYDGRIYHGKNEVGTISKKEFRRLWTDAKFIKYANEARAVYLSKHPNAILPEIPMIKKKSMFQNRKNLNTLEASDDYDVIMEVALLKKY